MSNLSRLCLAVVLSLLASLALAQSGAPESNTQEQQQRRITQPGNNAPVWRDVRSGEEHFTSIKGRETGVLVQSAGETWRRIRNGPVTFYGGLLVVLVAAAILGFYFVFGAVKLHGKPTGVRTLALVGLASALIVIAPNVSQSLRRTSCTRRWALYDSTDECRARADLCPR